MPWWVWTIWSSKNKGFNLQLPWNGESSWVTRLDLIKITKYITSLKIWMYNRDGEMRRDEYCLDSSNGEIFISRCHSLKGNQVRIIADEVLWSWEFNIFSIGSSEKTSSSYSTKLRINAWLSKSIRKGFLWITAILRKKHRSGSLNIMIHQSWKACRDFENTCSRVKLKMKSQEYIFLAQLNKQNMFMTFFWRLYEQNIFEFIWWRWLGRLK